MKDAAVETGRESRQHSPLRIAANRRNALKSTGPRTPGGKRRAALNSLTRGLVSQDLERQLRFRGEDVNEFRRLHRDLIGIFVPRDAAGTRVVEQMALTWSEKARRIKDWVAAGPPRCADLDTRLEQLLMVIVSIIAGRREWWSHRLAQVIGRRIGSPAQVRQQIESRLYVFGGRKRDRKYPRKRSAGEKVPPEFVNYVERAVKSILAGSGIPNPGPQDRRSGTGEPGIGENEAKRSQMG